jgi:hypothetical protein
VIPGVEEHSPKPTDRLLGAPLVTRNGHALNRRQNPIEVADNLAEGDFLGALAKEIAAAHSCVAVHPTLSFQVEHNMLEESFGNIIAASKLTDGNRSAASMFDEGYESSEGIVRSLGDAHRKTI